MSASRRRPVEIMGQGCVNFAPSLKVNTPTRCGFGIELEEQAARGRDLAARMELRGFLKAVYEAHPRC